MPQRVWDDLMADFYPVCPVDSRHGTLGLLETSWTRPDPAQNIASSRAGVDRISKGRERLRLSESVQMRLSCETCSAEVTMFYPTKIEVLAPGAPRTEPDIRRRVA